MDLKLPEANEYFRKKNYTKALNMYRLVQKKYPIIAPSLNIITDLCCKRLLNYREAIGNPESGVDISLTTISSRIHLTKDVIFSLLNQSLLPRKIFVYISKAPYLLDEGISEDHPIIKELIELERVEIVWVDNTGPYRKIVPYLSNLMETSQNGSGLFITADDDTLYPHNFIESLKAHYEEKRCIIAFRGRQIHANDESFDINPYAEWGLGVMSPSIANLPTGKDGVIYHRSFFTKEFLDINTAQKYAPTADDLWIKWHTALNGIRSVILNPNSATSDFESFPVVDYSDEYRNISLYRAHNSQSSEGKNDKSVTMLEKHFKELYGYNLKDLILKEQM